MKVDKSLIVPKKRGRKPKDLVNEVWKEVTGSDGLYQVSNCGRAKSFVRDKVRGRLMRLAQVKGFLTINLKLYGKHKTYLIHKIVADLFCEKPSPEHTFVSHIDWNIQNNHFSNLRWVTRVENYKRVMTHLNEVNKNRPEKIITYSKLKVEDVKLIKAMLQRNVKQNMIAKMFCVSEMQITRIKRGINWASVEAL